MSFSFTGSVKVKCTKNSPEKETTVPFIRIWTYVSIRTFSLIIYFKKFSHWFQWKRNKYIRIIVNLILIQLPFMLLRMPFYVNANMWSFINKPQKSSVITIDLNFIFQLLHLSFYCFNAILAYVTSSQLRKLVKKWLHDRKMCFKKIFCCCGCSRNTETNA